MPVPDEKLRDALLALVGDAHGREIVMALTWRAKSATDLTYELRIPASTVYRKIHELLESGVLRVERTVLQPDGKKFEMYRSTIRELKIDMRNDEIDLDVLMNPGPSERLGQLWKSLRKVRA